ncbi:hypothetical protein [Falsiroseomonas sp.]|uniref:hypothetical protein n=1 Tax=Falsiroseomonas sp. TaxID=2870721 RepID=UPI0034A280B5
MSMQGSVDLITTQGAVGWIFSRQAEEAILVQARLQGRIIGEARAERLRPDLAAAGLGDGHHGFEIIFVDEVDPALLPGVTVHPSGGDVVLPRTNLTGLQDFLASAIARFPAAGRHRSVHGGLWADRTDAARLLRGRIAAGATPAALLDPLRSFIEDGVAILAEAPAGSGLAAPALPPASALPRDRPLDPTGNEAAREVVEALPDLLFQPTPLGLLRALLDDNPVVSRAVLTQGEDGRFDQPSTAEDLPSPAECVLAVVPLGGGAGCTLDVVRGSHALPEFNAAGQSRWTTPGAAAVFALAAGASVDSLRIGPGEIGVVSAGTLCRLRTEDEGAALLIWCIPTRQTARRLLANGHRPFRVGHASGAMVSV